MKAFTCKMLCDMGHFQLVKQAKKLQDTDD